ncbi:hypothetical protein [Streptomyces sp. NPDC048650]|uniref:hypothetical protein n=1 Tax=unclassified Streptomyces TaxID=2593676 RepID=UPI0037131EFF
MSAPPQVGDCVDLLDPAADALTDAVDSASAEAEYRTSESPTGADATCGSHVDDSFHIPPGRGVGSAVCFAEL